MMNRPSSHPLSSEPPSWQPFIPSGTRYCTAIPKQQGLLLWRVGSGCFGSVLKGAQTRKSTVLKPWNWLGAECYPGHQASKLERFEFPQLSQAVYGVRLLDCDLNNFHEDVWPLNWQCLFKPPKGITVHAVVWIMMFKVNYNIFKDHVFPLAMGVLAGCCHLFSLCIDIVLSSSFILMRFKRRWEVF